MCYSLEFAHIIKARENGCRLEYVKLFIWMAAIRCDSGTQDSKSRRVLYSFVSGAL